MGNGASAATAIAASVFKMQQATENELNNIINELDTDTCTTLQKAINAKLGAAGSEMLDAAWLWESYTVKSKLATAGVKCECTGRELLTGKADLSEEDQAQGRSRNDKIYKIYIIIYLIISFISSLGASSSLLKSSSRSLLLEPPLGSLSSPFLRTSRSISRTSQHSDQSNPSEVLQSGQVEK
eukprot:Skav236475  [mRNA]  locus=scaffold1440:62665:63806:+ [translate_table: standard]